MSGPGGTKTVRCLMAFSTAVSLAAGLAACAYEDEGNPQPTAAGASLRPGRTLPAKDPDVLAVEARNYAELDQRLANVPGPVLLADHGPADGPGVGFSKAATVMTAGPHTVTARQGIKRRLLGYPDSGGPAPGGVRRCPARRAPRPCGCLDRGGRRDQDHGRVSAPARERRGTPSIRRWRRRDSAEC